MVYEMWKLIAFIAHLSVASSYQGAATLPREQLFCLAQAVYHEARGEDDEGQAAVAHVVLNRVHSSNYPNTICEVVFQPAQFSYITQNEGVDERSVRAAVLSYIGFINDPTDGALFYHNPQRANPRYFRLAMNEIQIGQHVFYNIRRTK